MQSHFLEWRSFVLLQAKQLEEISQDMFSSNLAVVAFVKCTKIHVKHFLWKSLLKQTPGIIRNKVTFISCHQYHKIGIASFPIRPSSDNVPFDFRNYFCQNSELRCWHCKAVLQVDGFSCTSCKALQYPDPYITFFKLFDIPQKYEVNVEEIAMKFKQLQKLFHPDRFVNRPETEVQISEEYSRLVNQAYNTLRHPFNRAEYLLSIQGIVLSEENTALDPEFLMEVMEKNDELEQIDSENSLEKFNNINNKIINEYVKQLSRTFQDQEFMAARDLLLKMKYFLNIDQKIKEKKLMLNIVD